MQAYQLTGQPKPATSPAGTSAFSRVQNSYLKQSLQPHGGVQSYAQQQQSRMRTSSGGDLVGNGPVPANPADRIAARSSHPHNVGSGQLYLHGQPRSTSGGATTSDGHWPQTRNDSGAPFGNAISAMASQKIKIQKNSKTILNRQQHIQSRDRSHSGSVSGGQSHASTSGQRPTASQPGLNTYKHAKVECQEQPDPPCAQSEEQDENLNTINRMAPSSQVRHNSNKLQNLLLHQGKQKSVPSFVQPLASRPKGAVEEREPLMMPSEARCEPFEAVKSPVHNLHKRVPSVGQSPYFMGNPAPNARHERKPQENLRAQITSQIGPRYANEEKNIVGDCGNDTSTFGRRVSGNGLQHQPGLKNPNELRIEETMGISHQVQQMITQRGRIESGAGIEVAEKAATLLSPKNDLDHGRSSNLQHPVKIQLNRVKSIQKINISGLKQMQGQKLVTSRNSLKQTKPQIVSQSKSLFIKQTQKSAADLKSHQPPSTRNQAAGIGQQSVMKLKIRITPSDQPGRPGIQSHTSRHLQKVATTSRPGSNSSSRIISANPQGHASGPGAPLSNSVSLSTISSNVPRSSVPQKQPGSKDTSPVHIHYHNLNYIQVIHKSSPSNKESSSNTTQNATQRERQSLVSTKPKLQAQQNKSSTIRSEGRPELAAKKPVPSLGKNLSTILASSKQRQVSQASNNSGVSASTSQKNSSIIHSKINASRRSSNQKISRANPVGHPNSPVGGGTKVVFNNNISAVKKHTRVNEDFVLKLQDSLFKQQNQASLMTDSLEGTEREAMRKQQNEMVNSHRRHSPRNAQNVVHAASQQLRAHTSQQKRAELMSQLSKYIKFNAEMQSEAQSSSMPEGDALASESIVTDDLVQENLRKFLQYLEINKVININEIQKDKAKMNTLINDIMKIEVAQLRNPNFMSDQKATVMSVASNVKNPKRSASGGSNTSHCQGTQGYLSGVDMSQLNNSSSQNQYNTSGQLNHMKTNTNSVAKESNFRNHQQYFSQNSRENLNGSTKAKQEQTTAGSMHGTLQKNNQQVQNQADRGSLECSRRQGTPVSMNGEQNHNTSQNLQNSQISATSYLATSQNHGKHAKGMRQSGIFSENSQKKLVSSCSQHSTKYNTSGDQTKMLQKGTNQSMGKQEYQNCDTSLHQRTSASRQQPISLPTQISQLSSQGTTNLQSQKHNTKLNNFFQSSSEHLRDQSNQRIRQQIQQNAGLAGQDVSQLAQPSNPAQAQQPCQTIHNTTINLQINANVDQLNISGGPQDVQQLQAQASSQRVQLKQSGQEQYQQARHSSQEERSQPSHSGQIASNMRPHHGSSHFQQAQPHQQPLGKKIAGASQIHIGAPSNSSLLIKGPLGIVLPKQKRGGSHEEQTRDRMKTLLEHDQQVAKSKGQSSRQGNALINQKAFGVKQQMSQHPQPGGAGGNPVTQKRVNSATTVTRSRSIHMKQEHLKDGQKQLLNEEIMREREKIIKYNKQFIKKYHKCPPTCLDFYKFVKKIGNGAFGQVYLAIHKLSGKFVAIKMIELSQLQDKYSRKKVFQEVYILKKIRHSNIIRLFEVFENKKHIMMVMEYAGGGDLYHLVRKSEYLTEDETKFVFKQIAQGIAHCHCRSVLHRDIKLDNILLDGEGGVKLCDFGVSRLVTHNEVIQEQCGTPAYLAPEMSSNSKYTNFYVDIWSLGILLYVMLQGTVPFKASTMEGLYQAQCRMDIQFPMAISAEAEDMIRRMLVLEPTQRLSLPELLSHPWLKNLTGPDGLPLESDNDENDDSHNFMMSLSFQRQECNLNPLSVVTGRQETEHGEITERCQSAINQAEPSQHQQQAAQIGNINQVNIKNLFFNEVSEQCKLSYMNYCAVTQDFNTYRIDEDALRVLESFGYPRQYVIQSINQGELNHATCCYELLTMH